MERKRERVRGEGFGGRPRRFAGDHRLLPDSTHGFRHRSEIHSLSRSRQYMDDQFSNGRALRNDDGWQVVQSRRRKGFDSDYARNRYRTNLHDLGFRNRERTGLFHAAARSPRVRDYGVSQFRSEFRPTKQSARQFSSSKVYFEDFPNGMDNESMKAIFAKYGVHGWVYVARKRNLRNLNFGFITIDGSRSIEDVIDRLNDIRIGPAILKASRARYLAPKSIKDPKPRMSGSQSMRIFRESKRDERSFADVVATKPVERTVSRVADTIEKSYSNGREGGNPKPPIAHESSLLLNPAVWKSRACMVRVSNIATIRNLYDILSDNGFRVEFAAPCGDDTVIVAFDSRDSLDNFMNGDWKAIDHVLHSVELIVPDYAPTYCLGYVDLMGIPPVFICEEVIRDLASRFGNVVAVDSDLARPDRLDVVSCLVSMPLGTESKELLVTLRNKEYKVYSAIRQGVGCDRCNSDAYSTESGSDSESSTESGSFDREPNEEFAENPREEGSDKVDREAVHSASIDVAQNSEQGNSAGPSSGTKNNLIIQEAMEEAEINEDALTFDVGRKIGVFTEKQRKELMDVLGGNR